MSVTTVAAQSASSSRLPTDPATIDASHAAVRADGAIQFDFPDMNVPAPEPPPGWLNWLAQAIGDAVRVLAPVWPYLLWGAGILLAGAVAAMLYPPSREAILAWWIRRRTTRPAIDPSWRPDRAEARQLLEEADQLAAQGRYADAVRLVLARSIEDIQRWRSDIVRPASTARELGRAAALPDDARAVFVRIATVVERGIFAQHPIAEAEWQAARADYANLALGHQ